MSRSRGVLIMAERLPRTLIIALPAWFLGSPPRVSGQQEPARASSVPPRGRGRTTTARRPSRRLSPSHHRFAGGRSTRSRNSGSLPAPLAGPAPADPLGVRRAICDIEARAARATDLGFPIESRHRLASCRCSAAHGGRRPGKCVDSRGTAPACESALGSAAQLGFIISARRRRP